MFLSRARILVALAWLLLGLAALGPANALFAQSPTKLQWSRAIPLSGALANSWYPALVADDTGQIALVWGANVNAQAGTLYVSKFDGAAWTRPIDVLIGGPESVAVLDGRGTFSLLYRDQTNLVIAQSTLPTSNSAQGWASALTLNRGKGGVTGDVFSDPDGVLEAAWFEASDSCQDCFRVVYNNTRDAANPASGYRVVSDGEKQARSVKLLRAPDGLLYAMWPVPAVGPSRAGIKLSFSRNQGDTWLEQPLTLLNDQGDMLQPLLFLDKDGKLILVYNLSTKDETYFQVSSDGGATWTDPAPIPGLFAAKPTVENDRFAVATDSAGIAHVIASGRTAKDQLVPGIYRVAWDGKAWSPLDPIYTGDVFTELPAVAISNGNRLHVAFTTRDKNRVSAAADPSSQVLYSSALTTAPAATQVPLPTFTPAPTGTPTPAATASPTAKPTVTVVPASPGGSDSTSAANVNMQLPLIIGLAPVAAILLGVVILNFVRRRR